jgi:hypothetical protein
MSLHLQMSVNRASTERQQSINRASTECQQSMNDFHYRIIYIPRAVVPHLPIIEVMPILMGNILSFDAATPTNEHQHSINRVSMIFIIASSIF